MDQKALDHDAEQLKSLGLKSEFDRSMSFWENFSLGFTYLSPVVGVYSVFALAIQAGGPPMIWNYFLVGLGQFLVCLVFGEVVSQYPISGGIYPWSLRLVGERFAWMSAWVYAWALFTSVAAVAVGGAPFLNNLLGIELGNTGFIWIAIGMILISTLLNLSGTKLLAQVAFFGFACELVGAILVGGYLLLFAKVNSIHILWDTFSFGDGMSYFPAFLASSVAAMFCYYGFEACGDVAEETPNASSEIPKSMRMTIYIGGGAAIFICLALLLSLPNVEKAISGEDADPVTTTLTSALGVTGYRLVIVIVMISFLSCLLSLQAAASRLLFSFARDGMIFGSQYLNHLSKKGKVPTKALLVTGIIPIVITSIGHWLQDTVTTIISFASCGIYVAFQMVVFGALYARLKGWKPSGSFTLGKFGFFINVLAFIYGIGAVSNMVWPRSPEEPWFINYGMIFTSLVVVSTGFFYLFLAKPHLRKKVAKTIH
ncbi:APC family permease [Leptospira jelokensis]|uniref:Amino acid permease n=1 Tax=Leptospira jelokensis TaxID=2484931 RepID=A0A4Z1A0P2_9LEPT|nr:APC family permease [Leptospira jelokensis]TGL69064.1 amino acid permease [Leptospira jelokensis]